jgi:hypothetical protein
MAIDRDARDTLPSTKAIMLAFSGSVSGSSWSKKVCFLDTKRTRDEPVLYVRSGSQPLNTDIKTYDVGNILIAYGGHASSIVAGEIWVEYDVELFHPQLNAPPPSAKITSTDDNYWWTLASTLEQNDLGIKINAPNTMFFERPGQYLLSCFINGVANPTGFTQPIITGEGTSEVLNAFSNGTYGYYSAVFDVGIGDLLTMPALTGAITSLITRVAVYEKNLG